MFWKLTLEFKSPYFIKYRGIPSLAETIVDSSTIMRAIIYALNYLYGAATVETIVSLIRQGKLRISSLLPQLYTNEEAIELLPIPSSIRLKLIRSTIEDKKSKKSLQWITPKALKIMLKSMENLDAKVAYDNQVKTVFEREEYEKVKNRLPLKLFSFLDYTLNRVDRITTASDIYNISTVFPETPLYTLVYIADEYSRYIDNILSSFKLLEDLGIGSRRRKGFGSFKVVKEEQVNSEASDFLKDKGTLWAALGYFTPAEKSNIELDKSLFKLKSICGIGGDAVEVYTIPLTYVMELGSTVKTNDGKMPAGYVKEITLPYVRSIIVFNPLFYNIG